MRNRGWILLLGLVVGGLLTAAGFGWWRTQSAKVEPLTITGDLVRAVTLERWEDYPERQSVEQEGKNRPVVPLEGLVRADTIIGAPEKWVFIGRDGFTVMIPADGGRSCYVTWTRATGWELVAPKAPPSANVKDLEMIVLVCGGEAAKALTLVRADGRIQKYSKGELLIAPLTRYRRWQGEAIRNEPKGAAGTVTGDDRATVYTTENGVALASLLGGGGLGFVRMGTAGKKQKWLPANGYLTIENGKICYRTDRGERWQAVTEIMEAKSIGE